MGQRNFRQFAKKKMEVLSRRGDRTWTLQKRDMKTQKKKEINTNKCKLHINSFTSSPGMETFLLQNNFEKCQVLQRNFFIVQLILIDF